MMAKNKIFIKSLLKYEFLTIRLSFILILLHFGF